MISPKSVSSNLRSALKCNNQTRGALPQVFPCCLSDQKQSWCFFALLTGCHDHNLNHLNHKALPSHPSWKLQSATNSFWLTLVWANNSLQTSGCPLMISLVCMLSASGWCLRDSFPSWSPQKYGTKPESIASLTPVRKWGARGSCQWLSSSQME